MSIDREWKRERERDASISREKLDALIEEARDPSHPLHRYFEWDDFELARRMRRGKARSGIRQGEIILERRG